VNAAKAQFFSAYNAALTATAAQPVAVAADATGVVPYIHEEIEAEPYIHVEVPAEPYVHQEGDSAPVAVAEQPAAAPVINNPVFNLDSTAFAPVQQVAFAGGCYNWKGEGVPCRTVF